LENYPTYWPQFYTATILDWKYLLDSDFNKNIIINSLQYLTKSKIVKVYAFVIMSNHIHLIWQPMHPYTPQKLQHIFLKYTAQQMKFGLISSGSIFLKKFRVNLKDREYQFWKRNSLSIEIFSEKVFLQKLNYIHQNPVRARMVYNSIDYYFSSANFYENNIDPFGILTNYFE